MHLKLVQFGLMDAPRLLIAHGLFGSARNWGVLAKRLSRNFCVTAVDMRNHGESPWSESHSYDDLAKDLASIVVDTGQPAHVIGHSMGGKAAMVLALRHPQLIDRLVIADIAPVSYDHTQAHLVQAMNAVDLTRVTNRTDADRQLAAYVEDATTRAFLLQSLDVSTASWRLNLATLDRDMPKILSFPAIDGQFEGPTLFLSGGASDYVQPEHRARIRQLFPSARFAKIKDAGHWLHAEKPREFEETVRSFLNADVSSDADR
ncbi:MAG: alpha/beta fold hydrolase [Pseudomonadota bacterium]